jgi:hypothetical protein
MESAKSISTSEQRSRSVNIALLRGLEYSSSACAVAGGTLLASNTEMSKYGFVILALSSGQMLISSTMGRRKSMMIYAGSVFCFVDCLGIYRWLLQ